MNAHTPGPAFAELHVEPQWAVKVGKPKGLHYLAVTSQANDEANARLLAASYTMVDAAARELGVPATELAKLNLASLIRAARNVVNSTTEDESVFARMELRRAIPGLWE